MKTRRLLKASQLIAVGACPNQVKLFYELFGAQVYVTVKRAESVADKFDFSWAANKLLSAPARAEYDRVRAQAGAEYDRVRAPARAEYDRVTAQAFATAYIGDA
jgi:hypothetical protein